MTTTITINAKENPKAVERIMKMIELKRQIRNEIREQYFTKQKEGKL